MSSKPACFIHQYSKVSHSFKIAGIALGGWEGGAVDAQDAEERWRPRLQTGMLLLFSRMAKALPTSPGRGLSALALAAHVWLRAGRTLPYHVFNFAEVS